MSPALAVRRMFATYGADYGPALVTRPRSAVVHTARPYGPYPRKPWCGQRGKRWHVPAGYPYNKRLCGRCTILVEARTPAPDLDLEAVATELALARSIAEVLALRTAVIEVGPTVVHEGRVMHARYADALIRVRKDQR